VLGRVSPPREVPMTWAPRSVSASPVARPMPREAPVTTATLPAMLTSSRKLSTGYNSGTGVGVPAARALPGRKVRNADGGSGQRRL
jgi:hypothetical protein